MENLPSNSQLDRLGERLRSGDAPSRDDLRLLQQFRAAHTPALTVVEAELQRLGFSPTSRTKTPGTIIDKLVRETTRLTSIQDIAGTRIVPDVTLDEQDAIVSKIAARLGGKVYDRRETPSHGYRAVHLVARVQTRRVEVQVRTPLQHLWAEVMERVADRFGRGIRYGEMPREAARRGTVEGLIALSENIAHHEGLRASLEALAAELPAGESSSDLTPIEDVAVDRFTALKRRVDDDEISFRRALTVILDALEEGESV
ncbi:MAG TPA: hypothetical protein VG318_07880 [Actinomycetota bacterium]|nr:hypothetical protein [Actinomycetota bacterium]